MWTSKRFLRFLFAAILLGFFTVESVSAIDYAWIPRGPEGGYVTAFAVDPTSPQTVYAGMSGGQVFKSFDGGSSWSPINKGLPASFGIQSLAIDPTSPQILYAGPTGIGGQIFKSIDGGETWVPKSNGLPASFAFPDIVIDPTSPQTIYAGTFEGISKSTDGGETWNSVTTGLPSPFYLSALAIDPGTPQTLYAAGYQGIYKTTNGGSTWNPLSGGLPYYFFGYNAQSLAIDPMSPQTIYAGYNEGMAYKSLDGGLTWSPINSGLPASASIYTLTVDSTTPQIIYASSSTEVFKSIDGGYHWSPVNTGLSSCNTIAIAPTSPETVYAGGSGGGGVFKSIDEGNTWDSASRGITAFIAYGLAINPTLPQTVFTCGTEGVFRSFDGGGHWSAVNTSLSSCNNISIAPTSPQTIYAGGSGGVSRSTDGGETWNPANGGLPASIAINDIAIDPTSPQVVYVVDTAFYNSNVFKSIDGGENWSPIKNGLPTGVYLGTLAVSRTEPQTIYAGGAGVYKSTDGGGNWSSASNGLSASVNVNALAIDPTSPLTVYAGSSANGVFKSTDGGGTWNPVNNGFPASQLVIALAIDPTSPQTIYAGGFGGLFKSENGGESWSPFNSGMTATGSYSIAISQTMPPVIYAGTNGGVWSYSRLTENGVMLFDQSTDTISVAGQTVLSNTATYETRILFTSTYNDGYMVFNEWEPGAEDKHLVMSPHFVNAFSYPINSGGLSLAATLSLNVWHHVAYVYDGSQERLYLDGNLLGARAASGDIADSKGSAFVGAIFRDGGIRPSIIGYLDTLRISDVARYSGSSFLPPPGDLPSDSHTQLLYNFDDPPGSSTVADLSGHGRTGTLGTGFDGATFPILVTDPLQFSGTTIFNAAADWSSTQNPNGVWSYNANDTPLPTYSDHFGLGQWWHTDPENTPAWTKLGNTFLGNVGSVVVHSSSQGTVGAGVANVTWTSPGDGMIDISGNAWDVYHYSDRDDMWSMALNGTVLAQCNSIYGIQRSDFNSLFSSHLLQGQSLNGISVHKGDILKLDIQATTGDGHFTGVDLSVQFVPTIEQDVEFVADEVNTLLESGALTQNQADGLTDKLEAAIASLDSGNIRGACSQLLSFIKQVTGLVNAHKLSPEEGQALIDAAEDIRTRNGC